MCWPGGAVPEGNPATTQFECSFGLRTLPDFEAEPVRQICEPACNVDGDCRAGERCLDFGACRPPCRAPTDCASGSTCLSTGVCVNARRFARIDCDGDGDLTPECIPSLQCDTEAIGGCAHPPEGEE